MANTGWKLVPVEPTLDMQSSGNGNMLDQFPIFARTNMLSSAHVYRAMLKAAPEAANGDDQALKNMEARKDEAYEERNKVVAALAWMAIWAGWRAGIARTAIPGWSEDWHGCVYIDFPHGQVSWHYHDSHAPLFAGLPEYTGSWDGHTTPEKYERVAYLCEVLSMHDKPYGRDPLHGGRNGNG